MCLLFLPPVFVTFEPCNVKTSQKMSKWWVNDEKWRDYFLTIINTKTSASGEVEASQNMAE